MTDVDPFAYRGRLERVVDGDTFDLVVDLGFHLERQIRVRLVGVDTAEIYGVDKESAEYEAGMQHTLEAESWFGAAANEAADRDALDPDWPCIVATRKTGKYGRYLADIQMQGDARPTFRQSLTEHLTQTFPEVASER